MENPNVSGERAGDEYFSRSENYTSPDAAENVKETRRHMSQTAGANDAGYTQAGAPAPTVCPPSPAPASSPLQERAGAMDGRYDLGAHEARARSKSRRAVVAVLAVLLAAALCAAGYFVWDAVREPDIASYADVPVTVVGLTDAQGNAIEGATLTAAEIYALGCERLSATNTSDKAGQGDTVEKTAIGFGTTMDAWLAQYGHKLTDYKRIVIHCSDDYETAILPNTSLDGEVYISIAKGKDALPEDMQPMRLIMPEMQPSQWVYAIDRITLEAA